MTRKRTAGVLVAVGAAVAVAGCGSDKPPGAPGSPEKPLVAQMPAASDTHVTREPGASKDGSNEAKPGYQGLLKQQPRRPKTRFTPCSLVTQAEARAIVGEPVREPVEAPQGPTCVYRTEKGSEMITLAVQAADFKRAKGRLQQPTRVGIHSRTGVCGQFGQPMLYVPISQGRMLTVAAPCAVAKQFASTAVKQLDR